jgi:hypothetical protein
MKNVERPTSGNKAKLQMTGSSYSLKHLLQTAGLLAIKVTAPCYFILLNREIDQHTERSKVSSHLFFQGNTTESKLPSEPYTIGG